MKWSQTLRVINEGFAQISGCWLGRLYSSEDQIYLNGFSLYRNRIPRLASIFADTEILEITETEMRGVTLYNFRLRINRVTDDPGFFDPKVQVEQLTVEESN